MDLILGIAVVALIVYIVYEKLMSNKSAEKEAITTNEKLPYKVADSVLTDAELRFYNALKLCVGEKAIICPKVGLKDIFFIGKGNEKEYLKHFNKIAKKHVDFLLCEPNTMKPLCGIELDDISHTSKKAKERDLFVEKVYKDANLELIRFLSRSEYECSEIENTLSVILNRVDGKQENKVVLCPKCSIPMVLRKANKGPNKGNDFYGCPNYPKCKEIVNIEEPAVINCT
ncbi:DUF2726 domain-containing protein [Ruminiclostridium herbifermentans]|uniref:DUF2726 domain-containing protein n=1 Tax=Ruminiclostridium herbifermentans TaxID=2488810 RepID=A0A4U7JJ09_9FIRM|nr:DUF2726 domain-containing protein [Ruminiclostridium herbifermentans]QNU66023.1 DUF2726 domain-containing protein [Ruminiclostridium herbifermentans]